MVIKTSYSSSIFLKLFLLVSFLLVYSPSISAKFIPKGVNQPYGNPKIDLSDLNKYNQIHGAVIGGKSGYSRSPQLSSRRTSRRRSSLQYSKRAGGQSRYTSASFQATAQRHTRLTSR